MEIHVVQPGDTLFSIAGQYRVPLSQLTRDNGLTQSAPLVVGQALVVRFPKVVHTVRQGDTLSAIAREYGITLRELYRNNLNLAGRDAIWPGETLVAAYEETEGPPLWVNGYAYPQIPDSQLLPVLPFLSYLTPFTYGFTPQGELVKPDDTRLIAAAEALGTAPLLHLSTYTREGTFSNQLAHLLLQDRGRWGKLLDSIEAVLRERRYHGIDVDFEYLSAQDAPAYAAFLTALRRRLAHLGFTVLAALAPKVSADQPGLLYEGHDYRALGKACDGLLLMTYEWGYLYGPPMAVAPLPNVRQVVEYALTEVPAEKLWLGVPNYGYDWPLPYVRGKTRARSLASQEALALARRYGQAISYDEKAQAPWFRYTDQEGVTHEVWFEDARSVRARLSLIPEYGLSGAGVWNLNRDFPQLWVVLSSLFQIRQE